MDFGEEGVTNLKGFIGREKVFPFWIIVMMGAWIILSQWFFSTGVSPRWDVSYHMNRVEGIKEGLLAGQFPVRIHAYQMMSGSKAPIPSDI